MAYCGRCQRVWREPEDEQGDHPCPQCGWEREEYCDDCGMALGQDGLCDECDDTDPYEDEEDDE